MRVVKIASKIIGFPQRPLSNPYTRAVRLKGHKDHRLLSHAASPFPTATLRWQPMIAKRSALAKSFFQTAITLEYDQWLYLVCLFTMVAGEGKYLWLYEVWSYFSLLLVPPVETDVHNRDYCIIL